MWHRAALMLEQMAFDNGLSTQLIRPKPAASEYEFEPVTSPQQVCAVHVTIKLNLFLYDYLHIVIKCCIYLYMCKMLYVFEPVNSL